MKTRSFLIIGLFLVVLGLSTAVRSGEELGKTSPKEGTVWRFRAVQENWDSSGAADVVGDYEVIYEKSKLTTFQLEGGQRVDAGSSATSELRRLIAIGQDERKYLDLPIVEGKKWTASYSFRPAGARNRIERSVTYRVKGIKGITTGAGTFQTFEIEGESAAAKYHFFYNHDPLCQCIVKYEFESSPHSGAGPRRTIELIKFTAPH